MIRVLSLFLCRFLSIFEELFYEVLQLLSRFKVECKFFCKISCKLHFCLCSELVNFLVANRLRWNYRQVSKSSF